MSDFMKYRTLKSQAIAEIRERITSGVWTGTLPREKEIGRILGISRNTVRGAVSALIAEKLIIAGGKGFQHTINAAGIAEGKGGHRGQAPVRIVRFLSSQPFHELSELSGTLYESLLNGLRPLGFRLVLEAQVGLSQRFSAAKLARLTTEDETAGWILHRQPKRVQQWFTTSGLPTVVTGSVFPGVDLPFVRFDYASASRHAVLEFVRRRHRRIAFVTPTVRIASEQDSVDGFLAVKSEYRDLDLQLIEHDGTTPAITRAVMSSRLGSSPITAYYTMGTLTTIAVYTTLLHAGIRIPEQAAIICRAGDNHLGSTFLPISHYLHDGAAMGRAAAKMLARVIQNGSGEGEQKEILPTYVPGKSV